MNYVQQRIKKKIIVMMSLKQAWSSSTGQYNNGNPGQQAQLERGGGERLRGRYSKDRGVDLRSG